MSTLQPQYVPRLAAHVRACLMGDQLIFLDLIKSKYVGVGGPQLRALSTALLGNPIGEDIETPASNAQDVAESMERLRRQGLLSGASHLEVPRQPMLAEPVADVCADDVRIDGTSWRQLLRLWRSTWVASSWLRRRSLADIANRVVALRARHADRRPPPDGLLTAVAAYMRLRPFALTSHDRCLNDSLTLVHFLASQGLFPQWVIGVRVQPFYAHSWVQSGGIVLNDLSEHVRSYQPILIV